MGAAKAAVRIGNGLLGANVKVSDPVGLPRAFLFLTQSTSREI